MRKISQDTIAIEDLDRQELIALNYQLREQLASVSAQLQALTNRFFRSGTEKLDPNQLLLFGLGQGSPTTEPEVATEPKTLRKPVKGHGRKVFPSHLPRVDIRVCLLYTSDAADE